MKKFYYLIIFLLLSTSMVEAQSGKQKRADKLYNEFAYLKAADLYKELIADDYHVSENSKKLGDTYMMLRSPENAVHYYGDVINEENLDPEYYYRYAQALRGVKRYDESRQWLQKYLNSGKDSEEVEKMIDKKDYKAKVTYTLQPANFNSGVSDFGVFVKGDKVYFVSARADANVKEKTYSWNGEPFLDVYVMDKNTGEIKPVPGDINTKLHDGPVTISPDGKTMYFTRNNYINNKEGKPNKNNKQKTNNLKIYSATLNGNEWTNVKELPFDSNDYSVGHPTLSPDGKTLYFTSDMPGGMGGTDIYKVSIEENNSFGTPQNLGEPVNTSHDETFPYMDADGTLYFSSNGHAGLGLFDIFKIDMENGNEVENLGESINSNMDDFAYFQVPDSKEGYVSSNREGGSDNIFVFNKLNPLVLKGTVTDAVNDKPVADATVRVMNDDNEQIAFLQTDPSGKYQTEITRGIVYPIEAKQIEYETFTGKVDAKNANDKDEIVYNIQLNPVKDVEYLAEIDNIYFDFDKSNIRPDAAKELDKLVELMKNEYPDLVIAIGSHADRRGTDEYNQKLSERRAKSTYDYLVAHGIDPSRIKDYKGYGESKPAIECDRCTEKEYQLNRRSMFHVVKME
ncbi:flagellar motor protein MotB [Christiangramia fulva]|uniref:Flagellar motor protein MotB n=1 Tax=Christiangramia fulva TaxID=2126553 RepID=A0A2R3Z784_9FLAO|nr:OmpA family protein [Christiangramia fulva]AVR46130.1 flagellar motor protein MotB [Christiangramia fulva]